MKKTALGLLATIALTTACGSPEQKTTAQTVAAPSADSATTATAPAAPETTATSSEAPAAGDTTSTTGTAASPSKAKSQQATTTTTTSGPLGATTSTTLLSTTTTAPPSGGGGATTTTVKPGSTTTTTTKPPYTVTTQPPTTTTTRPAPTGTVEVTLLGNWPNPDPPRWFDNSHRCRTWKVAVSNKSNTRIRFVDVMVHTLHHVPDGYGGYGSLHGDGPFDGGPSRIAVTVDPDSGKQLETSICITAPNAYGRYYAQTPALTASSWWWEGQPPPS